MVPRGGIELQLPFSVPKSQVLNDLCPNGSGQFQDLSIQWGRSGHCTGSVWYHFIQNGKSVLFSGDYVEDTQIYACDPIHYQKADLAVLDCAYGLDQTSYTESCNRLIQETKKLLSIYKLLLFPVPKYGRGLEILKLFSDRLIGVPYYADSLFLQNLLDQQAGGFWYRPSKISSDVCLYSGQTKGIVFVSDPQLHGKAAHHITDLLLSLGGMAIMTGTPEKKSYSEKLLNHGKMALLRYPVHLNYTQFTSLRERNDFQQVIPYHSNDFSTKYHFEF